MATKKTRPVFNFTGTYHVGESGTAPLTGAVEHPSHYNQHPSGVECIKIVEHFSYNIGSAMTYMWRAPHKCSEIEDLKKARMHLDFEIAKLERDKL